MNLCIGQSNGAVQNVLVDDPLVNKIQIAITCHAVPKAPNRVASEGVGAVGVTGDSLPGGCPFG